MYRQVCSCIFICVCVHVCSCVHEFPCVSECSVCVSVWPCLSLCVYNMSICVHLCPLVSIGVHLCPFVSMNTCVWLRAVVTSSFYVCLHCVIYLWCCLHVSYFFSVVIFWLCSLLVKLIFCSYLLVRSSSFVIICCRRFLSSSLSGKNMSSFSWLLLLYLDIKGTVGTSLHDPHLPTW